MDFPASIRIGVVSDIHYAGAGERARGNYCSKAIGNPLRRMAVEAYRHFVWLRDPFAHNGLLGQFIEANADAGFVVANGDYSCDSAFVGVSDEAACASAEECLDQLRARFAGRFAATIGDHELGKKPLAADVGGLRFESFHRCRDRLHLEPFWSIEFGRYLLVGITSTLIALPVYAAEALPVEQTEWEFARTKQFEKLRALFKSLTPSQRVILFCHDPTALPFIWRDELIRPRLAQVEHTIIGHLHSRAVFWNSRILAGMPSIPCLGHTVRRLSRALRDAGCWRQFRVTMCPSLPGIQLLKDGGFCTLDLKPKGNVPATIQIHRLRWQNEMNA